MCLFEPFQELVRRWQAVDARGQVPVCGLGQQEQVAQAEHLASFGHAHLAEVVTGDVARRTGVDTFNLNGNGVSDRLGASRIGCSP